MRKLLAHLASVILFNTAIAGVLTMLLPGIPFWGELIYSQCIGLSVMATHVLVMHYFKHTAKRWLIFSISLPGSVALGITLAFVISGKGSWQDEHAWQPMVLGLFFGLIGSITMLLFERIETETKLRHLIKNESEKREIEAHLKMLQAQIEPHFLFNTLANVSSLIDCDPILAKKLLDRLNDWLRIALARTRSERATLGDELEILENYLEILKIRFGERLRWRFEVSTHDRRHIFPPMLLQPLVENAVRHGIEPQLGGGEIIIRTRVTQQILHIEVSNSGSNMKNAQHAEGTGLANVRARLAALFGSSGDLSLQSNIGRGVTATLSLPSIEASS